ncbi:MAG: hypothetical protein HYS18_07605 [Burkholderiales bacterium]|nr:hypothetical protein [Burkholderiales bacterium]
MLLIVGALFLALGLFSGALLVAAPLGLTTLSPSLILWIMFPVLSVIGYVLFLVPANSSQIRAMSVATSGLMLLLAVTSIGAIILQAAALFEPTASTAALWYVSVIAGIIGCAGAASYTRQKPEA